MRKVHQKAKSISVSREELWSAIFVRGFLLFVYQRILEFHLLRTNSNDLARNDTFYPARFLLHLTNTNRSSERERKREREKEKEKWLTPAQKAGRN
jgi:hypothetical protein